MNRSKKSLESCYCFFHDISVTIAIRRHIKINRAKMRQVCCSILEIMRIYRYLKAGGSEMAVE